MVEKENKLFYWTKLVVFFNLPVEKNHYKFSSKKSLGFGVCSLLVLILELINGFSFGWKKRCKKGGGGKCQEKLLTSFVDEPSWKTLKYNSFPSIFGIWHISLVRGDIGDGSANNVWIRLFCPLLRQAMHSIKSVKIKIFILVYCNSQFIFVLSTLLEKEDKEHPR